MSVRMSKHPRYYKQTRLTHIKYLTKVKFVFTCISLNRQRPLLLFNFIYLQKWMKWQKQNNTYHDSLQYRRRSTGDRWSRSTCSPNSFNTIQFISPQHWHLIWALVGFHTLYCSLKRVGFLNLGRTIPFAAVKYKPSHLAIQKVYWFSTVHSVHHA